jgi:toxin ParE1/3/4
VTFTLYPEAELDLEKIWRYTVDTWGVSQAIHYIEELDAAFQLLADNPLLSRERIEFQPSVRIHHFKHHLIVYQRQAEKEVAIIRILHESMDIETQLSEDGGG